MSSIQSFIPLLGLWAVDRSELLGDGIYIDCSGQRHKGRQWENTDVFTLPELFSVCVKKPFQFCVRVCPLTEIKL